MAALITSHRFRISQLDSFKKMALKYPHLNFNVEWYFKQYIEYALLITFLPYSIDLKKYDVWVGKYIDDYKVKVTPREY